MKILGLNINHANSSVALIIDNKIVFAAEEERYNRIKNSGGFPVLSIKKALEYYNLKINDIDVITINTSPYFNLIRKAFFSLKYFNLKNLIGKIKKIAFSDNLKKKIYEIYSVNFEGRIVYVEHHLSHLASATYCSGHEKSLSISIDGSGDFTTNAIAINNDGNIKIMFRNYFPNSLGIFYQALTQFIGFENYGEEYKLMGLSGYGDNFFKKEMDKLISIDENKIKLDLDYFNFHKKNPFDITENGSIILNKLFNEKKMISLFGDIKINDKNNVSQVQFDFANSLQKKYEDVFFKLLNFSSKKYNQNNLDLSGGCSMNSLANGKILERTNIEKVYIQPASYDAGGALGSALYFSNLNKTVKKSFFCSNYLGDKYSNKECEEYIYSNDLSKYPNIKFKKIENDENLFLEIAKLISNAKVVGIFQGRLEWGARALGNRSILCDPRNENMKKILNIKIKKRESFRPFAPSIINDYVNEWFETNKEVPAMMQVFKIKEKKRKLIPAVTHIDGTGRLQTVSELSNPRYYKIIKNFFKLTGVPMIINTSFNENEPIVSNPDYAIKTFLRTNMDVLVLQNWLIIRNDIS